MEYSRIVPQRLKKEQKKYLELYLWLPEGQDITRSYVTEEQYLKEYKHHKLSKVIEQKVNRVNRQSQYERRNKLYKQIDIEIQYNKNNNIKKNILEECCFPFRLQRRVRYLREQTNNNNINEDVQYEDYVGVYVRKDAQAVDQSEVRAIQLSENQNIRLIPRNAGEIQDKEILMNYIVNNNDLCLAEVKSKQDLQESIQSAKRVHFKKLMTFNEIINNQQEIEEWSNFDEQIEFCDIQRNSGLLSDMKYQQNSEIKPEMLVCVTVYNEDSYSLVDTLNGIAENAERFLDHSIDLRELAVVIIFDGIQAIHESCLDWLDIMIEAQSKEDNPVRRVISKVFPQGRKNVNKNHIWPMHVSKETATVCQFKYKKQYIANSEKFLYLNTFFVAKHKNAQKLSSHIWFFEGFCKYFNPKYCVLLDCGTIPHEDALLNFYLTLESDEQVGGCCGYMSASNSTVFGIEGAQLFEYTFAHIFDKALEGLTGFIHVLPGAFSAYRWKAINDEEIFKNYFKTLIIQNPKIPKPKEFNPTRCCEYKFSKLKGDQDYEEEMRDAMTCQEKNMYLAEDRIFCLDIFCRAGKKYILKYVPEAQALTDVMQSLVQLLNQRRRWINGSWFAFIYNWKNMDKVLYSDHSKFRILLFYLSMLYAGISAAITYIIISLYYVVAKLVLKFFLLDDTNNNNENNNLIYQLLRSSLLILYFAIFVYSLNFKAQQAKQFFNLITGLLAIYNIQLFFLLIYLITSFCKSVLDNTLNTQTGELMYFQITVYLSLFTLFLHIIIVIYTNSIIDLVKGVFSYIVYAPSYINTMIIYSFCNIDDVSWGTRVGGGDSIILQEKKVFRQYKLNYLIPWISTNVLLGQVLSYLSENPAFKNWFLLGLAIFTASISFIKIAGAILFYILQTADNNKIRQLKERLKYQYNAILDNYEKSLKLQKTELENEEIERTIQTKKLKIQKKQEIIEEEKKDDNLEDIVISQRRQQEILGNNNEVGIQIQEIRGQGQQKLIEIKEEEEEDEIKIVAKQQIKEQEKLGDSNDIDIKIFQLQEVGQYQQKDIKIIEKQQNQIQEQICNIDPEYFMLQEIKQKSYEKQLVNEEISEIFLPQKKQEKIVIQSKNI